VPMYDYGCETCGTKALNEIRRIADRDTDPPTCGLCAQPMKRQWTIGTSGAFQDDIPGGILIHNAICNPDGTPKRYYSKSEIHKAAAKAGYYNHVEHVPSPGSDKNRFGHTTRWY